LRIFQPSGVLRSWPSYHRPWKSIWVCPLRPGISGQWQMVFAVAVPPSMLQGGMIAM
jgi:hypothetical protein